MSRLNFSRGIRQPRIFYRADDPEMEILERLREMAPHTGLNALYLRALKLGAAQILAEAGVGSVAASPMASVSVATDPGEPSPPESLASPGARSSGIPPMPSHRLESPSSGRSTSSAGLGVLLPRAAAAAFEQFGD